MQELPPVAAMAFLPLVTAIGLWVTWSDLKYMKIPNKAVLALLAVFVVIGPFVLPLNFFLWQLTHFVIILGVGFGLNMAGMIGAGDAKFAASMAPFIALIDGASFILMMSGVMLVGFGIHRAARTIGPLRRAAPDWVSWESGKFPMGMALGPSLIFYLVLRAFPSLT